MKGKCHFPKKLLAIWTKTFEKIQCASSRPRWPGTSVFTKSFITNEDPIPTPPNADFSRFQQVLFFWGRLSTLSIRQNQGHQGHPDSFLTCTWKSVIESSSIWTLKAIILLAAPPQTPPPLSVTLLLAWPTSPPPLPSTLPD